MNRITAAFLAGYLAVTATGLAYTGFEKHVKCETQLASGTSLTDLIMLQGSTPLLAMDHYSLGKTIAATSSVDCVFFLAPTPASAYWVAITNQAREANSYLVQLPTVGTNTAAGWWYYEVQYRTSGHTYWAGSGRAKIEATKATGADGLVWQAITSGNAQALVDAEAVLRAAGDSAERAAMVASNDTQAADILLRATWGGSTNAARAVVSTFAATGTYHRATYAAMLKTSDGANTWTETVDGVTTRFVVTPDTNRVYVVSTNDQYLAGPPAGTIFHWNGTIYTNPTPFYSAQPEINDTFFAGYGLEATQGSTPGWALLSTQLETGWNNDNAITLPAALDSGGPYGACVVDYIPVTNTVVNASQPWVQEQLADYTTYPAVTNIVAQATVARASRYAVKTVADLGAPWYTLSRVPSTNATQTIVVDGPTNGQYFVSLIGDSLPAGTIGRGSMMVRMFVTQQLGGSATVKSEVYMVDSLGATIREWAGGPTLNIPNEHADGLVFEIVNLSDYNYPAGSRLAMKGKLPTGSPGKSVTLSMEDGYQLSLSFPVSGAFYAATSDLEAHAATLGSAAIAGHVYGIPGPGCTANGTGATLVITGAPPTVAWNASPSDALAVSVAANSPRYWYSITATKAVTGWPASAQISTNTSGTQPFVYAIGPSTGTLWRVIGGGR